MNQTVQKNPFHPEELKYVTEMGVKVRSKSELNISSRLEVYKVPFIYEKELYINGRHLFPDFTIRKRDESIVIWEHFGLMDNPEYSERAIEKIQLYRQAGFVQCQNLICTYEEDIASVIAIDNIIKKFVFFF